MADLRDILSIGLVQLFTDNEYKHNKSKFSFTRKTDRNDYIKIQFLFFDYYPNKYEFGIVFEVKNSRIDNEVLNIPYQPTITDLKLKPSMLFGFGEFVPELKNESITKRMNCFFSIFYKKNVDESIALLKGTFEKDIFPFLSGLSTIDGIDKFFFENKEWAFKSHFISNILSDLTSAKLVGIRDYNTVYNEYIARINATQVHRDYYELLTSLYYHLNTI